MPASSRSATPRSSGSAPTPPACSRRTHGWNEPISGLLAAAAVAAAVRLALRPGAAAHHGLTLLMLTLAPRHHADGGRQHARGLTGGFDGLDSITPTPLFGRFEFNLLSAAHYYSTSSRCCSSCFLFVRRSSIRRSATPHRASARTSARMHAVGAPCCGRRSRCYTISAAIAGLAGGLWAQANAYVNLDVLGLAAPRTVLIMLVLGGYGRLYGAFVGAVLHLLAHHLAKVYPRVWQLGLGLLLVLIALFARGGMLGMLGSSAAPLAPRAGRCRERRHDERAAARNPRAAQELRRARRAARHQLPARARRAPRADRARTAPARPPSSTCSPACSRRAPARCCSTAATSPRLPQAARVKLGIARTFQINRLFRGLSVLENVYIAVAERVGAGAGVLAPAGARRDVIDEAMRAARDAQARRRCADQPVADAALRPPAAGRARDRARAEARGAAARRARGRRAERREPHHPRRHRRAAESIGVLIIEHDMDLVFRFAQRITVLVGGAIFDRRHARGDRRRRARARGLSRPGRRDG